MLSTTSTRMARVGLARPTIFSTRALHTTPRALSARPDTVTGFREDHAHGPIPGAHPSPEINVARTRSTLRVLVPSVAVMIGFIGWWFLGHTDRDHRKERIDVGPDGFNKLKGSKHRAAQQLANGERNADGSLAA
ncbi:uncharacterized protein MEPE_02827 [Melanopsichium pennsylvanicum]|uniref:Uncharacterized protein n=2 Tax=Melanopsichium pennsylvanicum TaxID=63383 RepID=A0AAJ5C533_9BASI|nr:hypothetical protein BN887_03550 [Melanopsichium pennsylvanicum 4]SNX84119.1 uncharacterized protein MEPE_02827 [Melanopsichium pennsylvanicum]